MPERYPPMPTPLPPGAPVNPFPQQKIANDAWSKSWAARGKWAKANPKLSGAYSFHRYQTTLSKKPLV